MNPSPLFIEATVAGSVWPGVYILNHTASGLVMTRSLGLIYSTCQFIASIMRGFDSS